MSVDGSNLDAGISEALLSSPLSPTTAEESLKQAGVKRGRGRPPKNGICRIEKTRKQERRGRPRRESTASPQKKETVPPASTPIPTSAAADAGALLPAHSQEENTFSFLSLEAEENRIVGNFQALLLTIDFLRRKQSISDFVSVQQGVEGITSGTFSKGDLIIVLSVCSKNFQVLWKRVSSQEGQPLNNILCISFSSEAQVESAYNRPISITERTEEYKKRFIEWVEQGRPTKFLLPPEPIHSWSRKYSMQTELAVKLSQAAEESKNTQLQVSNMSMEDLKNLAKSRGEQAIETAKIDEENKKKVVYASRVGTFLKICNAIRSTCSQFKKSTFLFSEIIDRLSKELMMGRNELIVRLVMIVQVIPEFLTIFPPDELVKEETLRINLNAPYGAIRQKLQECSMRANEELTNVI